MIRPKWFSVRNAALALPLLATAAPVSFSDGALQVGSAECQDGTCCPEPKSTCVVGSWQRADKYYKTEGSCTDVPPVQPEA